MFSIVVRKPIALCAVWLTALVGCSAEKLNELADKAKQTVSEQTGKVTQAVKEQAGTATDKAKEQLALAGNCEVQLDVPVVTTACYAKFVPIGGGRPNVAQFRSYRDPSQESFPSVMLQAQVQAGGWSELIGQSIRAEMFVQNATGSAIWSCPSGTQVEIKVVAVNEQMVTAEVVSGNLREAASGVDRAVTAKFNAVLE